MKTPKSFPETLPNPHRGAPLGGRRFWLLAVCCLLIVVIAALIRSRDVDAAAPVTPVATVIAQVSIRNVLFDPPVIEIKKGAAVEWKNDDLVPHTATAPSFDSGSLVSGQSWRRTFSEAGTFPYVCSFHPNMKGVVIVK